MSVLEREPVEVGGPVGASSFTLQGGVDVTTYDQPPNAAQPGAGAGLITTNDAGNFASYWYNGTVYGAHTVSVNPGGGVVAGVQWYQLGNINDAPTLLQQGIVATSGAYRYYPNLSVDTQGNMTLAYAYSSTSDYAGIRYTGRLAGDAPGTLQPEAELRAGEITVNGSRYGDYAGSALDVDGCTIWHFEEYARSGSAWGTWAAALRQPSCMTASVGGLAHTPDLAALSQRGARQSRDRLMLAGIAIGIIAVFASALCMRRRPARRSR